MVSIPASLFWRALHDSVCYLKTRIYGGKISATDLIPSLNGLIKKERLDDDREPDRRKLQSRTTLY